MKPPPPIPPSAQEQTPPPIPKAAQTVTMPPYIKNKQTKKSNPILGCVLCGCLAPVILMFGSCAMIGFIGSLSSSQPSPHGKSVRGSGRSREPARIENVQRGKNKQTPAYTIVYKVKMFIGGKHAAVIVPSLSRENSLKTRKRVSYAILKREGLKSIDIYNSRKAYNRIDKWTPKKSNGQTDWEALQREIDNPTPVKGWIGSINRDGQYYDDYRLQYQ